MTNDHFRQVLPNRRFRRLLPAAVAAVTIAASAPFAASAHAQAPAQPRTQHVRPSEPGKIAALVATHPAPTPRVQANSTT